MRQLKSKKNRKTIYDGQAIDNANNHHLQLSFEELQFFVLLLLHVNCFLLNSLETIHLHDFMYNPTEISSIAPHLRED